MMCRSFFGCQTGAQTGNCCSQPCNQSSRSRPDPADALRPRVFTQYSMSHDSFLLIIVHSLFSTLILHSYTLYSSYMSTPLFISDLIPGIFAAAMSFATSRALTSIRPNVFFCPGDRSWTQ